MYQAIREDLCDQVIELLRKATLPADGAEPARRVRPSDLAVLVRTGEEANQAQASLVARGIPAVLARGGSVLTSPAATQWRWLLEGLARPADPSRPRSAARRGSSVGRRSRSPPPTTQPSRRSRTGSTAGPTGCRDGGVSGSGARGVGGERVRRPASWVDRTETVTSPIWTTSPSSCGPRPPAAPAAWPACSGCWTPKPVPEAEADQDQDLASRRSRPRPTPSRS